MKYHIVPEELDGDALIGFRFDTPQQRAAFESTWRKLLSQAIVPHDFPLLDSIGRAVLDELRGRKGFRDLIDDLDDEILAELLPDLGCAVVNALLNPQSEKEQNV